MKRSKVIFLVLSLIFMIVIIYLSIDMAFRTQFPGSKANLKERLAPSESTDAIDTTTEKDVDP